MKKKFKVGDLVKLIDHPDWKCGPRNVPNWETECKNKHFVLVGPDPSKTALEPYRFSIGIPGKPGAVDFTDNKELYWSTEWFSDPDPFIDAAYRAILDNEK